MARPTKAEQERKRIADLMAEGKGPNGEPIEDANIVSETKNPTPAPPVKGEISITELEEEIANSTLGNGGGTTEKKAEGFDIINGDAKAVDTDDPNFIKPSGHDRFRESIIENESDANKATMGGNNGTANPSSNPLNVPPQPQTKEFVEPVINGPSPTPNPEDDKKKDEPMNPDLDTLSPTEKRKQVEMFADAIIETYSQLYEAAFTKLCTINMGKMEILDEEGKIRLSMTVGRGDDGDLTVKNVFVAHNEKVSTTFVVDEPTRLAIREPLIAVLMEKGIAPTPMVTLMITLGRHLLMGVFAAVELKGQMKDQLESFKKFRKEEIEREMVMHKNQQHNGGGGNNGPQNNGPVIVPTDNPVKTPGGATVVSMEEVMKTEITPVQIKSQSTENNDNKVTIEEVMAPE